MRSRLCICGFVLGVPLSPRVDCGTAVCVIGLRGSRSMLLLSFVKSAAVYGQSPSKSEETRKTVHSSLRKAILVNSIVCRGSRGGEQLRFAALSSCKTHGPFICGSFPFNFLLHLAWGGSLFAPHVASLRVNQPGTTRSL